MSQKAAIPSRPRSSAATAASELGILHPSDTFLHRHVAPTPEEQVEMLELIGYKTLDELMAATVPASIRRKGLMELAGLAADRALGEDEVLRKLRGIADQNRVHKSYIGMGYSGTITPGVILRNILENPGWYTQYTPYQAEIAQGRLEALLNFQTMVADLTGLPLAGASLLDEGTAAAEAMAMCFAIAGSEAKRSFFVAEDCHPQTIEVCRTRAESLGIELITGDVFMAEFAKGNLCGVLVQYPNTSGEIKDYAKLCERAHECGALVVAATDLLALTLITPPGEWGGGGADIAVGSAQRFGVPMGFGGPHAAFISTSDKYVRKLPGRIIGVSKDAQGNTAYRMAIQTREQHIKREKATSNICTAQALLAIMAGMYACYHGPSGLKRIATRVHTLTVTMSHILRQLGHSVGASAAENGHHAYFDTRRIKLGSGTASEVRSRAENEGINLRYFSDGTIGFSLDETTTLDDLLAIGRCFSFGRPFNLARIDLEREAIQAVIRIESIAETAAGKFFHRTSEYLTHPIFNAYHSEHEMLRYIFKLQGRDLSLAHSMIPLGSCTMKLNATVEMIPVTWPEFGGLHPFAPADQWKGYAQVFRDLESWLAEITGFAAVSLQPNAGSQGEYAGLLAIRAYHKSRGDVHRNVCLIPTSAHGTNPASAIIAGMKVVPVACDSRGNIDVEDLKKRAAEHKDTLAALMVTYPSTHGVFEESIKDICKIVHDHGGQVYMDGANMNAQVGLTSPGLIGADVCHLNLHKTFCIPHGGGGPGMGPIGVAPHLAPFLAGHSVLSPWGDRDQGNPTRAGSEATGAVSAAPFGSSTILLISWVYIALMGAKGLKHATEVAILSANYMAKRLEKHYKILYTGKSGTCAHEFILDCRGFDKSAGVKVDDIAKRLMDYGFHAPTMSFPVPGTLMIEPTESEPRPELDRFCDAMIAIREEIRAIEHGTMDREDNPLKHAPHTMHTVTGTEWKRGYTREQGAFPAPWTRDHKFWPAVGRIDNPYGDRNLICSCPPMSEDPGSWAS